MRIIKSVAFGDWLLFTRSQPLPDFVNDQTHTDDGLMEEAGDGAECLREAKSRIRDILFSFPDGLRMSCLEDHYQMSCNERLPYLSLGFSSVETFVLHLTGDVLQVKYTGEGLKLYPIVPKQPDRPMGQVLYPADAVGPSLSFERVKLPEVPAGKYNLEIFVAEVYHPHKFWFHLVGEEYAEALEKLMDQMEVTYCTALGFKYRMPEATVQVGQVCACPYGEQGYHRAVITDVRPAPEPVKVFYVDYGSVGTVPRSFLRFLPLDFFRLPAQALLGRLANILPAAAEGWTREASKTFLSLVDQNRILYAMVLDRSPSCVSLCLCDTNGSTDLHVNDQLVELGHAVFRNQSMDAAEPAVEEVSRPVPLGPDSSPAAAVQRRPPSPAPLAELWSGHTTPSEIDRLLQETLGAPAASGM
ncbi:tudor domain-containing protein 5-like [Pollicipes pollicipes]|uniref:tudor domain-containing protein 5-like n=1 Tax=Pollicipes pollicipes TaxID=41117 RepID=UPI001884C8B0|nr:tudor domain-containing protein 5-like [Pollicipes pollicipes]